VDHGRGTSKTSWKSHGEKLPEASQIWMIAIGPDTPALGEMKVQGQWHSSMIARTIFRLLGLEYPEPKAAQELQMILGKPSVK
jgi:hypothetical protein